MAKNLIIVESPNKAKKIAHLLAGNSKEQYIVKSTVGHFRDLDPKKMSIDLTTFEPTYVVDPSKKDIIAEIKKLVKECDNVYLASDKDAEGEKISADMKEVFGIKDKDVKRITFTEVTKKALEESIKNAGPINDARVNAQIGRRCSDRIIGYSISPILSIKVKNNLSAGRIQSPCLKLIVEREQEHQKFSAESSFKVIGTFEVKDEKGKAFSIKSSVNVKFDSKEKAKSFLDSCINKKFYIGSVENKDGKKSAPSPFTTSVFQQECSRKFGIAPEQAMRYAQNLFEQGLISYHRVDSVNLSEDAIEASKKHILETFGEEYSSPKQHKDKKSGGKILGAHEAIRPVDFTKTIAGNGFEEQKVYSLIYKRCVASQMADAIVQNNIITIISDDIKEKFIAKSQSVKFDGFLKLYEESTDIEDVEDSESNGILPKIKKGEQALPETIISSQVFTKPSPRYTEASLIATLEKMGLGRPSTYSSFVKGLTSRSYVEKKDLPAQKRDIYVYILKNNKIKEEVQTENFGAEKGKIFPTDLGKLVVEYLNINFPEIMSYDFTSKMEANLDLIEEGKLSWKKMLEDFYGPFSERLKAAKSSTDKIGSHDLGIDPVSKLPVSARIARFGPVIQLGVAVKQEKGAEKAKSDIRFVKIPENMSIDTITLEEALELLKWPRQLGEWKGETITAAIGKFGPYVKYGSVFASITIPPEKITLEEAIEVIKQKEEGGGGGGAIQDFGNIKVLKGQYGPYIKDVKKKKNYKIPTHLTAETITEDECLEIIGEAKTAPKKKAWGGKTKKKK